MLILACKTYKRLATDKLLGEVVTILPLQTTLNKKTASFAKGVTFFPSCTSVVKLRTQLIFIYLYC